MFGRQLYGLPPTPRLGDHHQVVLRLKKGPYSLPDKGVVVYQEECRGMAQRLLSFSPGAERGVPSETSGSGQKQTILVPRPGSLSTRRSTASVS